MYNFGSPRIFNYPVALSVQETIPVYFRVTHYKDIFVHLPPCDTNIFLVCQAGPNGPSQGAVSDFVNAATTVVSDLVSSESEDLEDSEDLKWNPFWHPWQIDNQIFYDEFNTEYVSCVGGEDPKCSDRYNVLACNLADHITYINVTMGVCAIKNFEWTF